MNVSSSSLITVIKSVKLPDEGAKWDAMTREIVLYWVSGDSVQSMIAILYDMSTIMLVGQASQAPDYTTPISLIFEINSHRLIVYLIKLVKNIRLFKVPRFTWGIEYLAVYLVHVGFGFGPVGL
jgi:hypothetical protein